MVDLYITSGTHVLTDVEERIENINDNIDDIDIIFSEGVGLPSAKTIMKYPILTTPILLFFIILKILRRLTDSEEDFTKKDKK